MIYIGLHGLSIPEWLEKQIPHGPESTVGDFKWRGLNVVFSKNGSFHVKSVFECGPMMVLNHADGVTIQGQSPEGGSGDVFIHDKPLVPTWFFMTLVGMAMGVLTK
jgi:hypothetical protein